MALVLYPGFNMAAEVGGKDVMRVGDLWLSFLLPKEEVLFCEQAGEEGNDFNWSNYSVSITHNHQPMRQWEGMSSNGGDFCGLNVLRSDIKVSYDHAPPRISLALKPLRQSERVDYISITGTEGGICRAALHLLPSIKQINQAENLTIDYVPPSNEYFVFMNEVGDVRAAKVGDVITRRLGKVAKITQKSILILEVEPDPDVSGGYREVPITIRVKAKS